MVLTDYFHSGVSFTHNRPTGKADSIMDLVWEEIVPCLDGSVLGDFNYKPKFVVEVVELKRILD
jgi:hypothetical protein